MELLIIYFKSILDIALYTVKEMINNPERTMYCILIGIILGIISIIADWFKDIMRIK